ncbi:alpha-ketoglutarate-dependent dioxygenase AlkB [Pseudoxanthomonas broegbernensis]|uniref:Alpha-ketoglutarate-dependent dioxygenase AlkB n=1 Tax=Pseudoxanthomonas broegbernensis TaxID=83619 RepID=A0A7V8GMN2_9GAMM|nr:alpha-ketoglutarate-dependent dioxygenase AlkB [Pseudoxanthomonas broegbernensis]KAF1686604.1 alpha-ketoglutarate-dependent dioxygenase AlkB [Pseudoxanthomonas broegbernensis]MBB6063646.1 alkylated DNA repair dioxygenase AlkB [Pseudoxanthomonas broegbernensis]
MEWIDFQVPDARLRLARGWLAPDAAASLMEALLHELPWSVHRVRLFGRELPSPRLSCWAGDAQAAYRYSGSRFEPQPWTPALVALRDRLVEELAHPFNSVLANRYRSGADAMGWHSDDEPELGPEPMIASLSLGATRRFLLRHRHDPGQRLSLVLAPGSLLLMGGSTQRCWKHALPRTARPVGERINLTFRHVVAR